MRRIGLAVAFWAALAGFVVLDALSAAPRDRFAEPPPLALGSERAAGAGHCSGK
jgi:hypothetical protein